MDQRIVKTQNALKTAYVKGPKNVKELCALAGVSRMAFYAHYQSLNDFRSKTYDDLIQGIAMRMQDMEKPLDDIVRDLCAYCEEEKDLFLLMSEKTDFGKDLAQLMEAWTLSLEEGDLSYTLRDDRKFALTYFYTGMTGLLRAWLSEDDLRAHEEMVALIHRLVLEGMFAR